MRVLLGCVAGSLAALIAFSYAGAWHPAGDSFAVIRYSLVAVLLVLGIVCHRSWLSRGIIFVCAVLLADRAMMMRGVSLASAPDYVIYQKNMKYLDYDETELMRDILAFGARVVTLQEVSAAHYDLLEIMKDTHPFQLVCDGTRVGAVAILSTDLIVDRACSVPAGIAVADIAIEQGQVRVVSLHLHWPWPHAQAVMLDAMLQDLDGAMTENAGQQPVRRLVGGDFNMVPWGHALRRVEDVFDVVRMGHVERTFKAFGSPLMIDHVMAGPNDMGAVEIRPLLGSDHHGVVGRIVFSGPSTHHHGDRSSGFRTRLR